MSRLRGFTLIELLVTTVVVAILGTILARMLVQDSRFVSQLEAMMDARQTARAAMNTMSADLRMVSQGGLIAANPKRIIVRVPYAWGMACLPAGPAVVASLIPMDSMMYAAALPTGIAWLDSTETYAFSNATIAATATPRAECTADSIRTLTGGQTVLITPNPPIPAGDLPSGSIVYLFEVVEFEFKASAELPNRVGLFRNRIGVGEEVLAPFDTAAGFAFYLDPNDTAVTNAPADLTTVTGLELRLWGESVSIPEGGTDPAVFDLVTRITFLNR